MGWIRNRADDWTTWTDRWIITFVSLSLSMGNLSAKRKSHRAAFRIHGKCPALNTWFETHCPFQMAKSSQPLNGKVCFTAFVFLCFASLWKCLRTDNYIDNEESALIDRDFAMFLLLLRLEIVAGLWYWHPTLSVDSHKNTRDDDAPVITSN